jgi:phosphate starvation-inducible PhoH-like protein
MILFFVVFRYRMFGIRFFVCCFIGSVIGSKIKGSHTKATSRSAIAPIGDRQIEYCRLLTDDAVPIVAGLGPAGCGKTFFACRAAVSALASGSVDRVVITRPIVAVDEELGFLPGSIRDKMDPWVRPIMDVLGDFYTGGEIRRLMDDGIVEIAPLAYMRGRTFRRAFIIADEMQNSTPNQMLMMLTRIGADSRMVLTGDLMQSDLKGGLNGLADFYGRWMRSRHIDNIRCVEFEMGDVQRSLAVTSVLSMYSLVKPKNSGSEDAALMPAGL